MNKRIKRKLLKKDLISKIENEEIYVIGRQMNKEEKKELKKRITILVETMLITNKQLKN